MLRKSLLCAALLFAGCDSNKDGDEASFRDGLPSKEMMDVKAPGASGQGLTAFYGKGQEAEYYRLTVNATASVNGGTYWVVNLISDITKYPPTTIDETKAVWGPHTDALSPTTWKLTVTKTGDLSYSWVLEGKAKADDDSAFKAILSGTQTVAVDANGERMRGFGSGELLIDWDAARTMPNGNQKDMGTAEIRYARPNATSDVTVDADFHQVRDENSVSGRVDATYHYQATPGAGGEFDFSFVKDIDDEPTRAKLETLSIRSRWQRDGVGRSDIKVTGGDLAQFEAKVSECWDSNFKSVYFTFSLAVNATYGDPAVNCGAFTAPEYSSP